MLGHDPRFSIHPPTIQGLPPTGKHPRKPFGHTLKYKRAGSSAGALHPFKVRGKIRRAK
jgi:hypothetical protein